MMHSHLSLLFASVALVLVANGVMGSDRPGKAGVAIDTPLGAFTPDTWVQKAFAVSAEVGKIRDMLLNKNFDDALVAYHKNEYLRGMAIGKDLSNENKGELLAGPVFELFSEHYGSAEFNDDYLLNKAFAEENPSSKIQMVEKTLIDAIPVQGILSYAYQGKEGNAAYWDKAAALYIGRADSEASPYTRATHRALNFNTTLMGTNGTLEAIVNDRIIEAFQTPSDDNYETILRTIKTIYAQSAIRNARLLDLALSATPRRSTDDHRGEGQALYRIIAPFVDAKDKKCHQFMDRMYDLTLPLDNGGGYYCTALECVPKALGLKHEEIGRLHNAEFACRGPRGGAIVKQESSSRASASSFASAAGLLVAAVWWLSASH